MAPAVLFQLRYSCASIQEPRIEKHNHTQALPRLAFGRAGRALHKRNFSVIYHPREAVSQTSPSL